MSENNQQYKRLYDQLLSFVQELHSSNKKRIRGGLWCMLVLPVVLLLARRLTDSNRVAFLLIWIFCMFVLAGYLIWIAYIDDSIQKKMREALETEKQFDDLLSLEPPRRLLEAYERLEDVVLHLRHQHAPQPSANAAALSGWVRRSRAAPRRPRKSPLPCPMYRMIKRL